ncbi:hypothetical protein ILYODFUR_029125 [Ilyodon furcidens]|uniref:Uncharacterized protein n=1 Tax=Ilyodon furcidens TaxID=33524 RepID=A0ABV0V7Y8_9TELE
MVAPEILHLCEVQDYLLHLSSYLPVGSQLPRLAVRASLTHSSYNPPTTSTICTQRLSKAQTSLDSDYTRPGSCSSHGNVTGYWFEFSRASSVFQAPRGSRSK